MNMQSIARTPNIPKKKTAKACTFRGGLLTTWSGSDWSMEDDEEEVEGCCWK